MLILKQNTANSVPTPPAGKGTIFLNTNDDLAVKGADGNVTTFPTAGGSNTQVYFNDDGSFGANANLTFDKTTAVFTVNGNVAAGNVLTNNLLYANGQPWDLSDPGGSNTQIQFNDDESFGGSANFTWDKSSNTLVVSGTSNVTGTFNVSGNATFGNANAGNLLTANFVTGTLTTNAQPNVTSVGKLTGLLVGSTANTTDFPNAVVIISQDNSGQSHAENIGVVGEAVADSGNTSTWGIGVLGEARANGATKATGVQGGAYVTNTNDTGAAVGVRGYATMTHAGGFNVGVLGNAAGSGLGNYAFYIQEGNVASIENNTLWDLKDNSTTAFAFNSTGKANIFAISTDDGNEGVAMSGTLAVTGNASAGNISTGGVLSVTGNASAGNISTGGALSVTGNANVGNLGTGGLIVATGNVSGGNLTTSGAVVATGNVSGGNLTTGGVVAATGNVSGGNLTTAGALSVTGNANVGNIGATGVVATTLSGTLTTASQPNVTTVGTLSSLTVTGNASAGNISTGGVLSVTGNANVGNIGAAAGVFSSTVAATGNVSGGNLTTGGAVVATGNVSGGNLTTGGVVAATGNISGGNISTGGALNVTGNVTSNANVVTDLIIGRTTGITITATGANQNINLVPTGIGTVNVGNFIISNLATPSASTDAATKQYVDDVAQGLHTHDSCNAATTTTLATISGGTVTYDNGTSGVGATLTTTGSYTTIDGVSLTNGMRILVKNEANAAHNGIYNRTSSTVLTRSTDFDTPAEMAGGDFTFVTAGTLYDNTGWVMPDPVTTVGTTAVNWTQFSGAGAFTAGTGLTLTGTQFSISNTTVTAGTYGDGDKVASFTVNGQGQLTAASNVSITANAANLTGTTLNSSVVTSSLTSVGTLGSLTVTGNVGAGNANLGNLATANFFTGTLTTAAQPNITSTGTLSGLTIAANGNITMSGSASQLAGANLLSASFLTGTLTTASQPNITSVGTLASLSVTGNVSAGNLTCTGTIGGAGANFLGNAITTGANTTAGTITGNWTLTAGSRWNATYADLAEKYEADKEYEPGTVLVFGGEKEVTEANSFDSTKVAGVVSTDPAYVMNAECPGDHVATIALQGRVPVKVLGHVEKGDLMVSAPGGYAKANNEARAGTIIGKSLENFYGESGIIEVVVGRV